MTEERDGPFDLRPSEMIAIMNRMGVHVSREQAVAFTGWAYSAFRTWRIENTPFDVPSWQKGIPKDE